ncbi:hypothetical protein BGZ61DRAFT_478536 [Ilyonectria robusta]|uniref:uncharacterized protein n=1 Tax=Ilyonectria robusta TaxID=1079257 RepID=UPI001E8CC5D4|nr:uncharacterized protein BGZ61DRAFT_478536 [Ilyonectria robusta]KAH8688192.1 hypothetical protein BGZ61DRAFT_478536 [Ilyonectria robusta]
MDKSIKTCERCGGPTGTNVVLCILCVERICAGPLCAGPPTGSMPPKTGKSSFRGAYDPFPTASGSGYSHEPDPDPITPPDIAASKGPKACTICNTPLEHDTYDYCTTCAQLLKDTAEPNFEPQTTGESSASGARRTTIGGGSSYDGYNAYQTGSSSTASRPTSFPPRMTDSRSTGNAYRTDAELMPPPPLPVPRGPGGSRPDAASSIGSWALLTAEDHALIARGQTPEHRADVESVIRNIKEIEENVRRSQARREAREAEDEDED